MIKRVHMGGMGRDTVGHGGQWNMEVMEHGRGAWLEARPSPRAWIPKHEARHTEYGTRADPGDRSVRWVLMTESWGAWEHGNWEHGCMGDGDVWVTGCEVM